MPSQNDPKYQAMVEDSCGCAFCDCGDEPELIEGQLWHIIDDDIYGNAGPVPCTKPVQ